MPKKQPPAQTPQALAIEPMLSMANIASMMQVSARTVRQWRAEGFLPAPDFSHGKTVRWQHATIAEWLKEQAESAV